MTTSPPACDDCGRSDHPRVAIVDTDFGRSFRCAPCLTYWLLRMSARGAAEVAFMVDRPRVPAVTA